MLLFAKRSFRASPATMLRRLKDEVLASAAPSLEEARAWLVAAGQAEQAVLDAGGPGSIAAVTDRAADMFLACTSGTGIHAAREVLLGELAQADVPATALEVRIPEGYAWYALYPDSYALTAAQWAAAHRGTTVAVIGIRSIGTSLGAVVAASLRLAGAKVTGRSTVRPQGHPFARRSAPVAPREAEFAIVVDEGPGLSGSSMAGAADALLAAGMSDQSIVFFPGHGNGPGAAASPGARRWWTEGRCRVSAAPHFVTDEPGLLWKFGGFAAVDEDLTTLAETRRARQCALARQGFALPSPASAHGWIALAGEGTPLKPGEITHALMRKTLGPYLTQAARHGGTCSTRHEAAARICAALAAAGLAAEDAARRVTAACRALPLAGDGRMGPEHWLRRADGRVLKRDATGADCEHDWAGAQSVLWDVSGAMVEWEMPEEMRRAWCHDLAAGGLAIDPLALAFHEAGYCCLALARARQNSDDAGAETYGARLRRAAQALEALR